jgi:hypothetical protein
MEEFQAPKKPINVFEILDQLKPAFRYVLRKWWLILAITFSVSAFMFQREYSKSTVFEAVNTFLLEDEILEELGGGSGGTGLLSILQSQGGTTNNKQVLVELALSYQLIEKTLLHSCIINGKWQSLAHRYLELTGRSESLATDKAFKNFAPDSTFLFGRNNAHDYLMRTLAIEIAPNIVATTKESGIIEHKMTFWNEEFTRVFSANHIREISEYYTQKRVEKAAQLLAYTGRKIDSLQARLVGQEYGLAQLNDEGFGVVMSRAKLPELNYKRNIGLITSQFLEAVTANNLARLEYEKRKPMITVVDDARSPLASSSGDPMKGAIIGLVAGLLLSIVGIGGMYFLLKVLKVQKEQYSLEAHSG